MLSWQLFCLVSQTLAGFFQYGHYLEVLCEVKLDDHQRNISRACYERHRVIAVIWNRQDVPIGFMHSSLAFMQLPQCNGLESHHATYQNYNLAKLTLAYNWAGIFC